ncbi:MAG: DUF1844 domain-containing protein [Kiritimatiellae bacterium]|nr:DUF1844 domain-containing protein [Kiritimatiellia bacterium]MDD5520633.1 DUF1844 domain-containing protein [Kiritimatiellia bacterium]
MTEQFSEKEMYKALFAQLVMMLSSSAMQQLGKLVNPITHKTEVDLEGAQITIDMLSMLREKTKGNLDNNEETMLGSILSSLQMNYVETMQSAPASAKKEEQPKQNTAPEDKGKMPPGSSDTVDKKDPKYHKSYGG